MTDTTSAMREALESAQKALKKLADAVFNDNGDMTISVPLMKADDCAAAYFARKKIEAALTVPAQADIHATTDDVLRREAESIVDAIRDRNPQRSVVYQKDRAQAIALVLERLKAHSPTPPRVDEKEMP